MDLARPSWGNRLRGPVSHPASHSCMSAAERQSCSLFPGSSTRPPHRAVWVLGKFCTDPKLWGLHQHPRALWSQRTEREVDIDLTIVLPLLLSPRPFPHPKKILLCQAMTSSFSFSLIWMLLWESQAENENDEWLLVQRRKNVAFGISQWRNAPHAETEHASLQTKSRNKGFSELWVCLAKW